MRHQIQITGVDESIIINHSIILVVIKQAGDKLQQKSIHKNDMLKIVNSFEKQIKIVLDEEGCRVIRGNACGAIRGGNGKKALEMVFDRKIFNTNCIYAMTAVVHKVCKKIGVLQLGLVVIVVNGADIVLVKSFNIG